MLNCLEYVEGRVGFVCFLTEVTDAGKKGGETLQGSSWNLGSIFTELCFPLY